MDALDGGESFAMLVDGPYLYDAGSRPGRTKNLELRRARQAMRLSQAQFAETIRTAGNAMGVPNSCSKRLVQKWENGEHSGCRPEYLRVLQAVTGLSTRQLGFRLPADDLGASVRGSEDDADEAGAGDGSAVASVAAGDGDESGQASAVSGMAPYLSDAMIAESMDRLSYALNHPSSADLRTAEFVEISTARLFDLEHHCPARLLAGTVDRHLAMVTAL